MAHNTYLDVVLSWGLFGVFVLLIVLFLWMKAIPKPTEHRRAIRYLPLVCLLLNLFDLSCLSASMFWVIVSYALIVANGYFPKLKQKGTENG